MTIIKSISTLMYTVWHVDKYKITFKLVINHWTNETLQHTVVSSSLSRPGIIDATTRYRAAARRLRNTTLSRPAPPIYVLLTAIKIWRKQRMSENRERWLSE